MISRYIFKVKTDFAMRERRLSCYVLTWLATIDQPFIMSTIIFRCLSALFSSVEEICKYINSLKPKKSPGINKSKSETLKEIQREMS